MRERNGKSKKISTVTEGADRREGLLDLISDGISGSSDDGVKKSSRREVVESKFRILLFFQFRCRKKGAKVTDGRIESNADVSTLSHCVYSAIERARLTD